MTVLASPATRSRGAGITGLLAGARAEVLVMSTRAHLVIDHENLRRGVRCRVLVPDPARPAIRLGMLPLTGAVTRTVPRVPTDALVIDGTVAVLPVDGTGTAVFRLPGVVTATVELFERVWASGVPLAPATLAEAAGLCPRERKLLALLVSGSTDMAAAAVLGVSVRTVRRMVRDLMNRLGARSRFQAGARAAERGWLAGG